MSEFPEGIEFLDVGILTAGSRKLMGMEYFEYFVLSQKPATTVWKPVTDYSAEARNQIEKPQAELLTHVLKPQVVLDAGCGYGYLMQLMRDQGVKVYGLDLEARWPDVLKPKCARANIADQAVQLPHGWHRPDLVICREVLEHLTVRQIASAIRNLCRWSTRYVYITTRFSSEHDLLRVDDHDDLDPTHISLVAKDFIRMLLTLEGYRRCEGLERTMDWRSLGRVLVYERG
jgi:SAM-dependent methyltransferase